MQSVMIEIFSVILVYLICASIFLNNRNIKEKIKIMYLILPIIFITLFKSITSMVTYDEVNFVAITNKNMIMSQNLFNNISNNIENFEGFGTVYWIIHLLVIYPMRKNFDSSFQFFDLPSRWNHTNVFDFTNLFGPVHISIIMLRIISFVPFVIFFVVISRAYISQLRFPIIKNHIGFYIYIFLILSSPVLWYTGKIAAPDLIVTGITALSGYYFIYKRYNYSFFLLVIGLSFRFSVAPLILTFVIFMLSIFILQRLNSIRQLPFDKSNNFIPSLIGGLIVYIFLNFSLLKDLPKFFENIPTSNIGIYLETFTPLKLASDYKLLWFHEDYIAWDHVSILSLSTLINPIIVISIIILFILKKNYLVSIFISILIFSTNLLMIATGTMYYFWYFFPTLMFLIGMLYKPLTEFRVERISDRLFMFIFVIQIIINVNNSFNQASVSSRWLDTISNFPNSSNCVRQNIELPVLDSATMGKSVFNDSDYNKWDVVRIFNQNEFLEFNMVVDKRSLALIDQENKKKLFYSYTLSANCGELQIFEVKPSQSSVN